MAELPWQISGGFIVSGSFETERESQMADAVNKSVAEALSKCSRTDYRRGVEDGRALYEPKSWIGRFFSGLFG